MTKKQTHQFGILAERISILFLRLKGYKILKWRYRSYFGEIDIIAKKSRCIILIEVKARRNSRIISEEVLRPKQIERIKKSAQFFISQNPHFQNYNIRFDFIEINRFLLPRHYSNFIS
jgi:putative endonuclease